MGLAVKNKEQGFSLDAVLGGAQKQDGRGKSKVPLLSAVSEAVRKSVDRLRELKETLDSTKSMMDMTFAEVVDAIAPAREELCSKDYCSSIKIPGLSGNAISLTWKDAYSKISIDNEDELRRITGDRYDQFFERKIKIEVRGDISEEMLMELVEAVGPERFAQFFEVQRWISPTPRYTLDVYNAFTIDERTRLGSIVHQYKPALRTK